MFTQHVVLDGHQYRPDIIQACEDRLNDMSSYCARVFLVRFDVRYPLGYPAPHSNELCSELLRQFKEYYTNHSARTHYVAVREQASSENPHYHVAFFIDGSKFDNGFVMHQRLTEIWSRVIEAEAEGTIQWCKTFACDYGLKIERPRLKSAGSQLQQEQMAFDIARQQARTWLLYLAKTATKGSSPFKVKEFFCSRLWT